jgi:hypothetical protein
MAELVLQCHCGAVRGSARGVAPRTTNHCICYCQDCQAFAHFLGRADEVLDAHGGTEIVQMSQANVSFAEGLDRIACVRLTDKGMIRWYAQCCNTPIGNTLSGGVPFIGVIRAFIAAPSRSALGPMRGRANKQSAKGDPGAIPSDGLPMPLMIARVLKLMVGWRLRGDHRRSSLFDAATGQPRVAPRSLSPAEREEIRRRCAAWRL